MMGARRRVRWPVVCLSLLLGAAAGGGCVARASATRIGLQPFVRDPDLFGMIVTDPERTATAFYDLRHDGRGGVRYALNRSAADDQLTVKGWLGAPGLQLMFSSAGSSTYHLDDRIDRYLIQVLDGRRLLLSMGDPLRYPGAVRPGAVRAVTLGIPPGLTLQDVDGVLGKINNDQTLIVLKPIVTHAPAVVREEQPMVEFRQGPGTIGSTLEAWWDDQAPEHLRGGQRRLLPVSAGEHLFQFVLRLRFAQDIHGEVPVAIAPSVPVVILIAARNRLVRFDAALQVWQGSTLVTDTYVHPPPGNRRRAPRWRLAPDPYNLGPTPGSTAGAHGQP